MKTNVQNILLIESGGTKSDWFWLSDNSIQSTVGPSMHPLNFVNNQAEILRILESNNLFDKNVVFYGAGCFQPDKRKHIEDLFYSLGVENIEVKSDLEAAIDASPEENGWVAILGTGSVLIEYHDQRVKNVFGGKGHLDGDEGSGFYFGKLVIEKWRNGLLTNEQIQALTSIDMKKLSSELESGEGKTSIAALAKSLDVNLFKDTHQENIKTFVLTYINKKQSIKRITLVGGYVSSIINMIEPMLIEHQIEVVKTIDQPGEIIFNRLISH